MCMCDTRVFKLKLINISYYDVHVYVSKSMVSIRLRVLVCATPLKSDRTVEMLAVEGL